MKDIVPKALVILFGLALSLFGIHLTLDMASPKLVGLTLGEVSGEGHFKWFVNTPLLYANAVAVCTPVMLLGFYSRLRRIRSISGTLERVAIPWSIFVSAYGFFYTFSYDENALPVTTIMSMIASSFFAVICGGLLATIGYYLREEQVDSDRPPAWIDYLTLFAILTFSYLAWRAALQLPLIDFSLPWLFIGTCYVFQNASLKPIWPVDRETSLELLLKSVTPATLGGVLLAIVLWVSAYDNAPALGPALSLGLVLVIGGSLTLAFVALATKENFRLRQLIWRSTWHLLEIYALLILIIYAPVSVLEMFLQGDI
jgi:hypothetical protein